MLHMNSILAAALVIAALAVLLPLALRFASRRGEVPGILPAGAEAIGTIVNVANGFPLGGLQVLARLVEPEPGRGGAAGASGDRPTDVLGETVTDSRGRFRIAFPPARQAKGGQRRSAEAAALNAFKLEVSDTAGARLFVSPLFSGRTPVTLHVLLPATPITDSHWREIGARMKRARLARLNDLTRSLISTSPAPMRFRDWDAATRHAVLGALEIAFLDPRRVLSALLPPPGFLALRDQAELDAYLRRLETHADDPRVREDLLAMQGKLLSFRDLSSVDWVIDLDELEAGNPGAALGKFQDHYKVQPWDFEDTQLSAPSSSLPPQEPALIPYRDYLLNVYLGALDAAKEGREVLTEEEADASLALLEHRFKQNFHTQSLETRGANALLITIVADALTAHPFDGYGFGIPAEQIEAQGTDTDRRYLDQLIGLTKLSATEIGHRYRIDLQRPDLALSSEVHENIYTLQNFFSDTFECPPEPFPVVPVKWQGRVPFYLEYEEWLGEQAPFYPENFYAIKQTYRTGYAAGERAAILKDKLAGAKETDWHSWYQHLFLLEDELSLGNEAFTQGEYTVASEHYRLALDHSWAVRNYAGAAIDIRSPYNPVNIATVESGGAVEGRYAEVRNDGISDMQALDQFGFFFGYPTYRPGGMLYTPPWEDWDSQQAEKMQFAVHHVADFVLPACRGDLALATGDYPAAIKEFEAVTGFMVYAAHEQDGAGYDIHGDSAQYKDGNLPYSSSILPGANELNLRAHPMELAFFRLRQGQAMLEWADALYRRDEPASVSRARELYKAVLWLHFEQPPIIPEWGGGPDFFIPAFASDAENPALTSQKTRARRGFFQIEAGLNFYGYGDDMVPTLRYRPLKEAADRFSALAKAAQQDFLNAMQNVEQATVEAVKAGGMIKKAALQVKIAGEQAKIATNGLAQAKFQFEQLQAAITAKEAEIADHESLSTQFKEYFSGLQGAISSLPTGVKSNVGSGIQSEAGFGGAEGAGLLGLGGGAGVLGGFAIFFYASYTTMSSMTDAANRRQGELNNLWKAQPLAAAQIDTRKREIVIAGLQAQIAQADIALANELLTFQADRFLNQEFWSNMAAVMRRVLRRYLELSARSAWFAERALAYEQDRPIRVIRFDYFPVKYQDVTGADLLQLDLAELEATRLTGIREMIPVKHTLSMARDFPLAFAQLRKTGRCTFQTHESAFREVYAGTYGYRVIAVTLAVSNGEPVSPLRALLVNEGFSLVTRIDEEEPHISLRPRDALPLSEFRLRDDLAVYGLPGEALMPFEGSGIETVWGLELSIAGNPYGLDTTMDILLAFDLRAYYSHALHQKTLPSSSVSRLVLVRAAKQLAQSLADLQGAATTATTFDFDLAAAGLPPHESNRQVTNLVIFLAGKQPLTFVAMVSTIGGGPDKPQSDETAVPFEAGVALSNAPPLSDGNSAPQPLNKFVGKSAEQIFRLKIDKAQNPGVDFSTVSDIVLGVEYQAAIIVLG
jgi:Tc toxin complex TcA C-terminal TcB-binding domain